MSWTVEERNVQFGEHETWVRISQPDNPRPAMSPVFVLHGGPGMAHNYMLPFEQLAADGRTVIHYDQLGCGNSTHLPEVDSSFWTPSLFVDEFFNLVEALGFDRYHLVGQSWGGMLTAEIAVRQPEGLRSLSILNSPASMELWREAAARLRSKLPAGMDEEMRLYEENGQTSAPEYLKCVDEFYRRHVCMTEPTPQVFLDSVAQMEAEPTVYHTMNGPNEFHVIGTLRSWSIIDRLPKINRPALVLAGEHDEATPETWQPYLDGIADVKSVVVEGASHCAHLEKPDIVLDAVGQFLAGNDA
ncbi:proline iminopeptidase-family hydrolase [Brevibacterium luteolum]|uniref:proline iminopeptidase-family hydrolase n=1 Tax=Brevibacterium luteolum TaxID=199591 RepID=UPI0021AF0546|nr:proline iminopeptidase-family hydrolase [Brevibacterium luteolum]MCT1829982.1 proline iminopeptidase-family hydrolase [Brevibacterium luteolum]